MADFFKEVSNMMSQNPDITYIYDYEEYLLGNVKDLKFSFEDYTKGVTAAHLEAAGVIWRYAITKLLRWTPEQADKYLTAEILQKLKIYKILDKVGMDTVCDNAMNYKAMLHLAFPNEIKYNRAAEAIAQYKRYAKIGEWSNERDDYRAPKKFFSGSNGMYNANIVLRYVISQYLSTLTTEELYEFFADTKEAALWLDDKSLSKPVREIYLNPLDYLHNALPPGQNSSVIYYNCKLNNMIQAALQKKSHKRG